MLIYSTGIYAGRAIVAAPPKVESLKSHHTVKTPYKPNTLSDIFHIIFKSVALAHLDTVPHGILHNASPIIQNSPRNFNII